MEIDHLSFVIDHFRIKRSETKKIALELSKTGQQERVKGLIEVSGGDVVNLTLDAKMTAPRTGFCAEIYVIASDSAKVNIDANILVGRLALESNASLLVKTLILGGTPGITVLPKMEVLNKESKAVHGVSTMRLTKESLFYAESRGLDEVVVKKLLVDNVKTLFDKPE